MAEKTTKQEDKIRLYKLQLSAHKPKNRSSKHERWLKGRKTIERCLSGEALKEMANNGRFQAQIELNRRAKKRDKKEAKA